MKNVVVEGCSLVADTGIGNIKIETDASKKVKVDQKGVYAGTLTISITGLSGTGFTNGSGTGTLTGTSVYNKVDGGAVVLEGDQSAQIPVNATTTSSPASSIVVPTIVTIVSAGQTVVKAD